MLPRRDHNIKEPTDIPLGVNVEGTMSSFWDEFLHEKFSEEGDGVLLALTSLQKSITG
jgi:hypothetical protein